VGRRVVTCDRSEIMTRHSMRSGFTLLEALISSVIFFIAISIGVMAFMAGSRHFSDSNATLKACHDSSTILGMIITELREAEPSASAPSNFSLTANSVSFRKYHRPTDELMYVTWRHDSAQNNVVRDYSVGGVARPSHIFGENIMNLGFTQNFRDQDGKRLRLITVTINAQSKINAPGGVRRNIITVTDKAYLRSDRPTEVNVTFN
jgi:hypothetical protein